MVHCSFCKSKDWCHTGAMVDETNVTGRLFDWNTEFNEETYHKLNETGEHKLFHKGKW